MKFLYTRMKLVVEPTGALATAALLAYPDRFNQMRVGIVVSGGNVDLKNLGDFFRE
jgi:threonine dehydratase